MSTEPPITQSEHAAIRSLLERFGHRPAGEPKPIANSVINFNVRVPTDAGVLMVRRMKASMPRERAEQEHRAMRWATERGLPANPPLADEDGQSVFDLDGRLWAVFPWLEGRSFMRRTVTPDEAEFLGRTHALTHRVLRDHPVEGLHRNSELSWDAAQAEIDLAQVLAVIDNEAATPILAEQRGWVVEQLEMLRTEHRLLPTDFELPVQAVHGDFHERNVMVDAEGNLLAVIDWERFCLSVPALEVIRALTFAILLDPPHLQRYLQGYGSAGRLEKATIRPSVDLWWQDSMHNTWTQRERFLRGNVGVEQFLEEGAVMLRRYRDPAFREYLAAEIERYCAD